MKFHVHSPSYIHSLTNTPAYLTILHIDSLADYNYNAEGVYSTSNLYIKQSYLPFFKTLIIPFKDPHPYDT